METIVNGKLYFSFKDCFLLRVMLQTQTILQYFYKLPMWF